MNCNPLCLILPVSYTHLYRMGKDQFFSREMAEEMARLTAATGREISVLIERNGSVCDVSVGHFLSLIHI